MKNILILVGNLFVFINVLLLCNLFFWITSDIQQKCIKKLENKQALNIYEIGSIYSIHAAVATFGYFVSPEAARQEFYLSFPHKEKVWKNTFNYKKQGRIGLPYTRENLRIACAVNGFYQKDNTIFGKMAYPYIKEDTIILGFRFNEGLLNYLQTIGLLFPYKVKYYG